MDNAPPPSHYEYVVPLEDPALVKKRGFAFMNQLEGWCSREKGSLLMDLVLKVKPEVVVEIGVWGGKSLVPMAAALQGNRMGRIYGIDPWSNIASIEEVLHPDNKAFWGRVDHEAVMQRLVQKIKEFGLQDHITLIQKTSEDAPLIYDIDILHIDGNHSEKTSYDDVRKWVPLVKSGGWIIFDDMSWYENGVFTTAKAVSWLNENCIKLAEFQDACIWGICTKP